MICLKVVVVVIDAFGQVMLTAWLIPILSAWPATIACSMGALRHRHVRRVPEGVEETADLWQRGLGVEVEVLPQVARGQIAGGVSAGLEHIDEAVVVQPGIPATDGVMVGAHLVAEGQPRVAPKGSARA